MFASDFGSGDDRSCHSEHRAAVKDFPPAVLSGRPNDCRITPMTIIKGLSPRRVHNCVDWLWFQSSPNVASLSAAETSCPLLDVAPYSRLFEPRQQDAVGRKTWLHCSSSVVRLVSLVGHEPRDSETTALLTKSLVWATTQLGECRCRVIKFKHKTPSQWRSY